MPFLVHASPLDLSPRPRVPSLGARRGPFPRGTTGRFARFFGLARSRLKSGPPGRRVPVRSPFRAPLFSRPARFRGTWARTRKNGGAPSLERAARSQLDHNTCIARTVTIWLSSHGRIITVSVCFPSISDKLTPRGSIPITEPIRAFKTSFPVPLFASTARFRRTTYGTGESVITKA